MDGRGERYAHLVVPLLIAILVVLGAGIVAFLGLERSPAPLAEPTAPETASPAAPDPDYDIRVETAGCVDPPDPFGLLCEVHTILAAHFVDPIDDAVLVDGAIRGLDEAIAEAESPAATSDPPQMVACALPAEAFAAFCDAYADRLARHDIHRDDLVEAAVREMVAALGDPNTAFVPPHIHALYQEELTGEVEGIGALVHIVDREDREDGSCRILSDRCVLVVVSPIAGGPAEAVGVRAGDRIRSFDGEPVDGETIHEAVARGRGPAGSEVVVGLERDGRRFEVTIVRDRFAVPDVDSEMLDQRIGYIRVFQFGEGTESSFRDAARGLVDAGADAIVLDLRNNPGGLTTPTRRVADEMIDGGTVFSLAFASGERDEYTVGRGGILVQAGVEIVVLVNQGTASAAEILAAALSEHGVATLVGEPTFGKATAQSSIDVSGGGAVRVTVARWLTPGEDSVDGVGVRPDHLVADPTEPGDDPDHTLEQALVLLRDG